MLDLLTPHYLAQWRSLMERSRIEDMAVDLRAPRSAVEYLKRSREMRLAGDDPITAAFGPFHQMLDGAIMLANQTAITGTAEAAMFPVAQFSGFAANQLRAGQLWYMLACGIATTPASAQGNITITPRYGTSTSGTSLGASAATALAASASNAPWKFEYLFVVRTIGNAGANSTVIGNGEFSAAIALIAAATGNSVVMGSTASVSVDASIASGLFIGVTMGHVSDTMTAMAAPLSSLN